MNTPSTSDLRTLALDSKAWPHAEAKKLLKRYEASPPEKGYVLFQTGYGPSGLPHIGTFGEVARTTMVRNAFAEISDLPTRLICFSDDMDGMRKVPGNVPNAELLEEHLGKPLSRVPDPFGTHESFAHHNNAKLRDFLDQFGFEYEFVSSTECYESGRFDQALLEILGKFDKIRDVILPTLGEERRQTYSPFLPVSPKTGAVLQVPMLETDAEAGTVTFEDEDGERQTVSVAGGAVKCQWKADWAMRWHALQVDYEMSGKDLMESVRLSSIICRILGTPPPDGFTYELFLDEKGEKISKTKGNGLTIEEWLTYATPESLGLYMFQSPKKAKRLYFDVIPKTVDEYYTWMRKYAEQEPADRIKNPAHHIHGGEVPEAAMPIEFGLLLNLVSAAHVEDKDALWGFVSRYAPGTSPEATPELDRLLDYALSYYRDFIQPQLSFREPTDMERGALEDLIARLEALPEDSDAETIQGEFYAVGKEHPFDPLRAWFQCVYECLLGQSQGPRMGSFAKIYGLGNTVRLIRERLG
ncbi:MAG: lysine--tRNA ligase [Acidobacteriota bacterium]